MRDGGGGLGGIRYVMWTLGLISFVEWIYGMVHRYCGTCRKVKVTYQAFEGVGMHVVGNYCWSNAKHSIDVYRRLLYYSRSMHFSITIFDRCIEKIELIDYHQVMSN